MNVRSFIAGVVVWLCFLAIMVLMAISVIESIDGPITDHDVERYLIPYPYEIWKDKDGNDVRVTISPSPSSDIVKE